MWIESENLLQRTVFLCLLAFFCLFSSVGYTMTTTETTEYIKIPTAQWQTLKSEFNLLNNELNQCKEELNRIKKPSNQLREELAQAQDLLLKLKKELDEQKTDLTVLSQELKESRESLQTLKKQIDKERRVHKRQVWQNRIWCLLIGVGIGCAVK